MKGFYNGCSDPKTLQLFEKFESNPHCHTLSMGICEDCESEYILVGFTHYSDEYTVKFYTVTELGEVYYNFKMDNEWCGEYHGDITIESLLLLLSKLPHINDYMIKD